jgi:hypothetical protein
VVNWREPADLSGSNSSHRQRQRIRAQAKLAHADLRTFSKSTLQTWPRPGIFWPRLTNSDGFRPLWALPMRRTACSNRAGSGLVDGLRPADMSLFAGS